MSIIAFVFTLSVLIVAHEFGHFIIARRNGVRVERFSIGFGPKIWGVVAGETEYRLSLFPLGGYVKLSGQDPNDEIKGEPYEYLSKSVGARSRIVAAGPFLNYILGFLIFSFVFMVGSPTLTTEIGELIDGYPARSSGLEVGDSVREIDGAPVSRWEDMADMIHKKTSGDPVVFTVFRDTKTIEIAITPSIRNTKDIFGGKTTIALIGVAPSQNVVMVRYDPITAFYRGGKKVAGLTAMTYRALWSIATGKMSAKESMAGPIGIFVITGKVAAMGFVHLLHLMGVLSVSLAIFNILPVPVLDGGHLLFLGIEKLMRKPVSVRLQEVTTNIGLSVLIMVMAFFFYNDIVRFNIVDAALRWFGR
ncbi:MAG: RIP metalloprotease RseP [Candidatus Omnitrophota bacterium]